jgi:hypothetical protein
MVPVPVPYFLPIFFAKKALTFKLRCFYSYFLSEKAGAESGFAGDYSCDTNPNHFNPTSLMHAFTCQWFFSGSRSIVVLYRLSTDPVPIPNPTYVMTKKSYGTVKSSNAPCTVPVYG